MNLGVALHKLIMISFVQNHPYLTTERILRYIDKDEIHKVNVLTKKNLAINN